MGDPAVTNAPSPPPIPSIPFVLLCFEMFPTPRLITFTTATQAIMLAYLAIPVWVVSMTCIKTSVALMLLKRFRPVSYTTRWWRPLLVLLIAVQLFYFATNMVYSFIKCRPLVATWDISTRSATCYTQRTDFFLLAHRERRQHHHRRGPVAVAYDGRAVAAGHQVVAQDADSGHGVLHGGAPDRWLHESIRGDDAGRREDVRSGGDRPGLARRVQVGGAIRDRRQQRMTSLVGGTGWRGGG